MKLYSIAVILSATAALLPTYGNWEKRPVAYVWTGEEEADKTPEGLLRGKPANSFGMNRAALFEEKRNEELDFLHLALNIDRSIEEDLA